MVGLTGFVVAFGVLVVQMATQTLSPRFMRLWYRDGLQKAVLGTFVGTLTFALALLRAVSADSVPDIGVTVAGSRSPSASSCSWSTSTASCTASDRSRSRGSCRRPERACSRRCGRRRRRRRGPGAAAGPPSLVVCGASAGAIQAIDRRGLLETAIRHDCVLVLPHAVGDIVPHGSELVRVHGAGEPPTAECLRGMLALGEERTIEQDPAFALRILVDIAIRALSPAVNDPTTACQVLGGIEDLLLLIGESDLRGYGELRDGDGRLRVLVGARRWEDLLSLALTEIREYGATATQVTRRTRALLEQLEARVRPEHRAAVLQQMASSTRRSTRWSSTRTGARSRACRMPRASADRVEALGTPLGGRFIPIGGCATATGADDRPMTDQRYGETVRWEPATPRIRPAAAPRLVGDPGGVGLRRRRARAGRGARAARRGRCGRALARVAERDRAAGAAPRCGCRSWSRSASSASCSSTPALLLLVDAVFPDWMRVDSFADALLMAVVIAAVGMLLQVIAGTNDDDEYTLRVTRRIARRLGADGRTDTPGIIFLEIDGLALPVLRRAMRDGNAPTMARWIADARLPPRGVGDRPLVADRRQPGRDPARLQRGHPGVPVGREGDRDDDGLLVGRRLRRDRAPALDRHRPARRRRRQPRQPAVRRGRGRDPHRQPDGRREAGEPRLPRLPGQRLQRHPAARALPVGGRARVDRGRAAEAPRRASRAATAAASIRSCAARCASSSAT